jgi:hypothetical protein
MIEWRERASDRHDLARMNARDFGDIAVPPALIVHERQRSPLRKWSFAWGAIRMSRQEESGDRESAERYYDCLAQVRQTEQQDRRAIDDLPESDWNSSAGSM